MSGIGKRGSLLFNRIIDPRVKESKKELINEMEMRKMEDIADPTIMNMAKAVIMSGIEKLRSLIVETTMDPDVKQLKEELINQMEILVKEKNLEGRGSMLRFLVFNVFRTDPYHQLKVKYLEDSRSFKKMLQEIINQLCILGADGVEEVVVGLDEDVKCFIDKINRLHLNISYSFKSQPFSAHIKGFPGSGKTTLARQLFHHAEVVPNFDFRAWVNCKDISRVEDLFINLIGQLTIDNYEGPRNMRFTLMEHIDLKMKLEQQLKGKRFFIVLDDITLDIYGKFFQLRFNQGDRRSMLLLIIRDSKQSYSDYFHEMKPLDSDKSWELLLKTISSEYNKFPKQVVRKAKAMLMKHSGGLPLAIKEIAMEWAKKLGSGAEWEDVVESEDLELRETLEKLESTVYKRLDPDMRSLFLHLGFFKLGKVIRIQRLLLTLVTSGVLGEEQCDFCLSKMSGDERIIEIKRNSKDWKHKNAYVNGIFHKLSIMKLRKCDEGALYRAVYCSREKFNCTTDQNERLLCVSFNGGGRFDDSQSFWMCFNQIRVLDFEDFGLKFLPKTVGDLIELRYLGLRNNYIEELPQSLGNLKNLEVLDIALNFMVNVPDIICEMSALVHLYMSDIVCTKPLRIEALRKLKTLTYISVDNWAYELSGLLMMSSLCTLGIEGLNENSDVTELFSSLALLENLDSLVLRWFRFKSMPFLYQLCFLHGVQELKLDGLITMLPSPKYFPPNLFSLTLVNSCLDDDPMPVLEKLESLGHLKLKNAYVGRQMVISECGFPKLRIMCIEELWQLRNIQVEQGGLKKLKKLEIYSCPCLHTLPLKISTKKVLKLEMVTNKNIATQIKKSRLYPEEAHVDIQP